MLSVSWWFPFSGSATFARFNSGAQQIFQKHAGVHYLFFPPRTQGIEQPGLSHTARIEAQISLTGSNLLISVLHISTTHLESNLGIAFSGSDPGLSLEAFLQGAEKRVLGIVGAVFPKHHSAQLPFFHKAAFLPERILVVISYHPALIGLPEIRRLGPCVPPACVSIIDAPAAMVSRYLLPAGFCVMFNPLRSSPRRRVKFLLS